MANCLPEPLAASKGRALICEGTAFGATQEKGGCRFTRSCQGSRLGILDLVENPGAGKRPVVSPSIQGEIPALKGQESRGKSRHVPLDKKQKSSPIVSVWQAPLLPATAVQPHCLQAFN